MADLPFMVPMPPVEQATCAGKRCVMRRRSYGNLEGAGWAGGHYPRRWPIMAYPVMRAHGPSPAQAVNLLRG